MSITAAELVARVTADTSAAERDLSGFAARMGGRGGPLGALGTTMGGVLGGTLLAGGIASLGRGLVSLGKTGVGSFMGMLGAGADFEAQMDGIAAVLGGTQKEASALADLVIDLGMDPNLKVNTQEAAAAVQNLATAGLTAEEILSGAAYSTVLLANATGGDFGQAATVATDVMSLFNIQAGDMSEAINGITAVANVSKFDLNDYQLAIAQAGGVAALSGVDFEDFNATIAATSPAFNSGSDAGTSFKTFLQRLQPTTKESAELMGELGLLTDEGTSIFYDATGALKGMDQVAGIMNETFGAMTEAQQAFYLGQIFGTDAMRTAGELTKFTREEFAALVAEMGKTDAMESAAVRTDNLRGALDVLAGSVEAMKTKVGAVLAPVAQRIVEAFTPVIDWATPKIEAWATGFAAWADQMVTNIQAEAGRMGEAFNAAFAASQATGAAVNVSWAAGISAAIDELAGAESRIGEIAGRLPAAVEQFNKAGGGLEGWAAGLASMSGVDLSGFTQQVDDMTAAISAFSDGGGGGLFTALAGYGAVLTGAKAEFDKAAGELLLSWDNFALKLNERGLHGFKAGTLNVDWAAGELTVNGQTPYDAVDSWLTTELAKIGLEQEGFRAGTLYIEYETEEITIGGVPIGEAISNKIADKLSTASADLANLLDEAAQNITNPPEIPVVPVIDNTALESGGGGGGGWGSLPPLELPVTPVIDEAYRFTTGEKIEMPVEPVVDPAEMKQGLYRFTTGEKVTVPVTPEINTDEISTEELAALFQALVLTVTPTVAEPEWGNPQHDYPVTATVGDVSFGSATHTYTVGAAVEADSVSFGDWTHDYTAFAIVRDWRNLVGTITLPAVAAVGAASGSGSTQSYTQNATGDPLWKGGYTWVGERGPELVRLPRGSRIYDDQESQRMAGSGATVTVNAQVRSDADLELLVRRVVRSMAGA